MIVERRDLHRFSIHEYHITIPNVLQMLIQAYPLTMVSHVSLRTHSVKFHNLITGLCGNMNDNLSDDAGFINSAFVSSSVIFSSSPPLITNPAPSCQISRLSSSLQAKIISTCNSVNPLYTNACRDDVCQTADIHAAEFYVFASRELCLENSASSFTPATLCPSLCPGLCSLRGTCVSGTCQCDPGTLGHDCSANLFDRCFVASFPSPTGTLTTPLQSVSTSLSTPQFYDYNSVYHSASTGLESVESTVAFVYQSTPRIRAPVASVPEVQTSLVVVHGKPQSGVQGDAKMDLLGVNGVNNAGAMAAQLNNLTSRLTGLFIEVKDDPSDLYVDHLTLDVSSCFYLLKKN